MNKGIQPEISIIIVNYNSNGLLADCIESIIKLIRINFEIIVFDNDSEDDSILKAEKKSDHNERIKLIRSAENIGFAKANNKATELAKGKYLHFLNPDTIINSELNKGYEKLLDDNRNAVFVTGLTESDGSVHKMKHLIPTIGNYFNALIGSRNISHWNIGASIIIDRTSYRTIGGWAEDYFMYAEDLDLFYQTQVKKIPVVYMDCSVTHIGKGTTGKIWNNLQRAILIERSTRRFYSKYNMTYQYFIIRPIQLAYMLIKFPRSFPVTIKAIVKSFCKANAEN
jgi:GT2 family glycosyltransferase